MTYFLLLSKLLCNFAERQNKKQNIQKCNCKLLTNTQRLYTTVHLKNVTQVAILGNAHYNLLQSTNETEWKFVSRSPPYSIYIQLNFVILTSTEPRKNFQIVWGFHTSKILKTRCVVNATNAPTRSQSFQAMFNLFQFQGG
jgi:hypothetical protein